MSRRRLLAGLLVVLAGTPFAWLWAVESWFRPAWCCRVPEWICLAGSLIAVASLAWLGARRLSIGLPAGLPFARLLSEMGEETYPMRQRDAATSAAGVFSYIAQAYIEFEAFSGRRGAPELTQVIRARE